MKRSLNMENGRKEEVWWALLGSNQRPMDYESTALPLS